MSNKAKKLQGGLETLFGNNKPQQEQASTDEAKAPEFKIEDTTEQDEQDLINTIDNEELREKLRAKRMDGRGRPRKNTDKNGKRTDGYSRTSLILQDEKVAKIREIAFRETLTMKEIFELAMDIMIEKYENKNGEVIPQPENYKKNIKDVFN